jgi:hypothetical protein
MIILDPRHTFCVQHRLPLDDVVGSKIGIMNISLPSYRSRHMAARSEAATVWIDNMVKIG